MIEPKPGEVQLRVCHRCIARLDVSAGGVDLPRRIRETLAARGLEGCTRVLPSGCLGFCPTGEVSVLILRDAPSNDTYTWFIDPARDGEDLADHLQQAARP